MAITPEDLRKMLGVSEKEAERLREKVLGKYPLFKHQISLLGKRAMGIAPAQGSPDTSTEEIVDILQWNQNAHYEGMVRAMRQAIIFGGRGGKTAVSKRALVESMGSRPAAWYPPTDAEVDREYEELTTQTRDSMPLWTHEIDYARVETRIAGLLGRLRGHKP